MTNNNITHDDRRSARTNIANRCPRVIAGAANSTKVEASENQNASIGCSGAENVFVFQESLYVVQQVSRSSFNVHLLIQFAANISNMFIPN